jgi:hypothetical protein
MAAPFARPGVSGPGNAIVHAQCAAADEGRGMQVRTPIRFRATGHRRKRDFLGRVLAAATLCLCAGCCWAGVAQQEDCSGRHSTTDAWWTGPLLANSAATLPRGHSLVESYLFDDIAEGSFDSQGRRRSAKHENSYGSLTYVEYALTDRAELGLLPTAGYNQESVSQSSSGAGLGDWLIQGQRRFTTFAPCSQLPTISLAMQQTLPTGRYDRLDRPSDGMGAGAYTTNLALFTQTWFWLPTGRIVRMRVNASDALSSSVKLQGASVYGTTAGFSGSAHPGRSFCLDAAWEYSLTRRWVLATDVVYHAAGNTRLTGYDQSAADGVRTPVVLNSGSSGSRGYAPAIEYSWKPYLGVLVGARIITGGQNAGETITPAFGINLIH